MLTPAVAHIPLCFVAAWGSPLLFALTDLFVLACITYVWAKNRGLHPACMYGTLLIAASQPLCLMLSTTGTSMRFATWLVGLFQRR